MVPSSSATEVAQTLVTAGLSLNVILIVTVWNFRTKCEDITGHHDHSAVLTILFWVYHNV